MKSSRMLAAPVDVDSGAAKLIVAGRVGREAVLVQNAEATTNVLYVGHDDTVTSATGLKIGPGEEKLLPTAAAIYGRASVDDTDVRYAEFF